MANITNLTASFVLLAVLVGLTTTIYDGLESNYGVISGDNHSLNETYNSDIGDQFKALYLMKSVADTQVGITKLIASTGAVDIIGGIITVGVGALKTVAGVIVIPYQITNIVVTYYGGEIPGIIAGLVMMIVVYVGMIVLAVFLRRDRI